MIFRNYSEDDPELALEGFLASWSGGAGGPRRLGRELTRYMQASGVDGQERLVGQIESLRKETSARILTDRWEQFLR